VWCTCGDLWILYTKITVENSRHSPWNVLILLWAHTQPVLLPIFRDYLGEPVPKEIFFWREDNRGRHTDHPAGCHSIWINQRPTSFIPHFYARCPSCRNPPTLSWLGTGIKYSGLHTQWLCFDAALSSRSLTFCISCALQTLLLVCNYSQRINHITRRRQPFWKC